VLSALEMGIHPQESFGRIHHLPTERLAEIMDGLRERGLVDADGRFTAAGRDTKQRIEDLTDELAAPPYDALSPAELDELITELEPLTATLVAAGSR
jgi:ADP-heptose:LPS heptosyltransferase